MIHLCKQLPNTSECRVIRNQLLRSATSVGANYRAACHARSRKDFIAKLALVEEEADESQFWLELLDELEIEASYQISELRDEAHQLTAIIVASKKTARQKR